MTDSETMEIAVLAKGLLPRTTDEQAAEFRERIAPYDFRAVREILRQFALENEEQRLHMPRIMERIYATSSESAAVRTAAEVEAFERRRREEASERERVDAQQAEVRAFCAAHADQVEAWRAEVTERMPWLASFVKRPTLASPMIMSVIYETFGRAEHSQQQQQGGGH